MHLATVSLSFELLIFVLEYESSAWTYSWFIYFYLFDKQNLVLILVHVKPPTLLKAWSYKPKKILMDIQIAERGLEPKASLLDQALISR